MEEQHRLNDDNIYRVYQYQNSGFHSLHQWKRELSTEIQQMHNNPQEKGQGFEKYIFSKIQKFYLDVCAREEGFLQEYTENFFFLEKTLEN